MSRIKILILMLLTFCVSLVKTKECDFGFVWDSEKCIPCGRTFFKPNLRIVGGKPSVRHSWPSQVLIEEHVYGSYTYIDKHTDKSVTEHVDDTYQCGGTLINSQTVLTAGHCITDKQEFDDGSSVPIKFYKSLPKRFTVYLGIHNTRFTYDAKPKPPKKAIISKVSKVLRHKDFNDNNLQNDIALLILTNPVAITPTIQPACLPKETSKMYPKPGSTSFAAGWGRLYESDWAVSPDSLYNVAFKVYESNKCDNSVPSFTKEYNKQICAGDLKGEKDTCQGDSGGGLIMRESIDGTIRNVASGIVSYGEGCARKDRPGIYTRVSYYLKWIKNHWEIPKKLGRIPPKPKTTRKPKVTTKIKKPAKQ